MTDTSAREGSGRRRSLGLLGGTFNPPHMGHLAVARHARAQLGLERVLMMPAGSPPHKPAGEDPGARHRLRMCELAAEGQQGVRVCALELDRDGPSYTVDTVRQLQAIDPDSDLTLIVGADTAATLGSWREPQQLLAAARLAVAAREGCDRDSVLEAMAAITDEHGAPAARWPVRFLELGTIAVSSSGVRARAARGEELSGQVGEPVARYIERHRLYAAKVAS